MNLTLIEKHLGHRFSNPKLLERALTHRSWAYESVGHIADADVRAADNESMEFIGDSVLGLAIADHLFKKFPAASEGELTMMKHKLVSTATLAEIADSMGLGDHLRVGKGEEKTGGRQKTALLADTVEAVIAAVFLDSGYVAARVCIGKLFAAKLDQITPKGSLDYKSLLQETLQADKLSAPVYVVTRTEGEPHSRTFYVDVKWENGTASGIGRSIKEAEMKAAGEALNSIDQHKGSLKK